MSKRKIFTIAIYTVVVCVIVCAISYVVSSYMHPATEPTVYGEASLVLPETAEIVSDITAAIKEACDESGSITFLSWNGVWGGTDGDTDIVLQSNGKVVLTEHGILLETYNGTYSVVEATDIEPAKLILDLNEYDWFWPEMSVYRDQSELLLMPPLDSKARILKNQAGEYIFYNSVSFWPLRQIPNRADN